MPRVRSLASFKRLQAGFLALMLFLGIAASGAPNAGAKEQLELGQASKSGSYRWKGKERCLLQKVNRVRAANGKRKLGWDKQVGYVARQHAKSMANSRSIWHDDIGSKITRWRSLGQNVGRAGGCKAVFKAFMASGGHRANILGSWKYMGFGVARAGGKLYAAQIFESRRNPGNIYHYP